MHHASADVLWRVYGCKTLLNGVCQHGEIISQRTGKVSTSCIPQIKFKLLPNLMVTLLNPQAPTISSSLMINGTDRQKSGDFKRFLRGWMTSSC